MAKVLIVDDEEYIRDAIRDIMEMQNHKVDEASSGNQALNLINKTKYDAIFLDIKMANGNGLETLPRLLMAEPELPIIMISGHGTIETAVEAMRLGAFDYLEKPLDNNRIIATLRNALDKKELTVINRHLKKNSKLRSSIGNVQIIGESKPMVDLMEATSKAAAVERSVLITGENGSGKELLARKVHELSPRANKVFLAVNCAAMVESLLETTLFGSKKGTYTSSIENRMGLFEEASGGTLFLDEIGDMSPDAQAKILRAIELRVIQRVGDTATEIPVDVRIVAATNRNLEQMIKDGTFRLDLYHRLQVLPLRIPALHERKEDIPLLITYFNNRIAEEFGYIQPKVFSNEAIEALCNWRWPGNIRELCNAVDRLNIMCGDTITLDDIKKYVLPKN